MPASLFSDMERAGSGPTLEEQRALQLAFELSMLGLSSEQHTQSATTEPLEPVTIIPPPFHEESRNKKSQNMTECVPVPSSEHVAEIVGRQGELSLYPLKFGSRRPCASLIVKSGTRRT